MLYEVITLDGLAHVIQVQVEIRHALQSGGIVRVEAHRGAEMPGGGQLVIFPVSYNFV